MKLEAVLFDCDGVISETEKDGHQRAFNEVFESENLGFNWDDPFYKQLLSIGGGKERLKFYFNEFGWPDNVKDRDGFIAHLHQQKARFYLQYIEKGEFSVRPGITELMYELKTHKVPFGICSVSKKESVKHLTNKLLPAEIHEHLSLLISGDEVTHKKPDPEIYIMAAKKLNVHPEKCVVIEDSDIGMKAAKSAGMKVVVTKSYYTQDHDFKLADLVLNDLSKVSLKDLDILL